MDLQEYHYVLAIAEYRNITKAAKELYISQPQLSRFLTQLEQRLQVTLFDRRKSPLQLTYAGERYVEYAQKVINIERNMASEFAEINGSRAGYLTIGISRGMSRTLLPYVLPPFQREYPRMQIALQESSTARIQDAVRKGTVDLGIFASTSFSDDIDYEFLQTQRILLVVPQNHELYYPMKGFDYAPLAIKDIHKLNDQPFVLLRQDEGMSIVSDSIFQQFRITPRPVLKTQDADTAFHLAVAGMGLTFSSEHQVVLRPPDYPYCCYQLGTPPYTRTWVVAYKKKPLLTEATQYLIQLCQKYMAESYQQAKERYARCVEMEAGREAASTP